MTLRDQLDRAKPRLDGPTYDALTGKLPREQYERRVREDLRPTERPAERRQAADSK